ncbi:MAG TPA: S-layer homology domain-containing protein [Candidatus Scatomorpha gallistercoris]|nr:S-layer homology domain-containing protein [Candidatus Scatomorpha gallistercoris]
MKLVIPAGITVDGTVTGNFEDQNKPVNPPVTDPDPDPETYTVAFKVYPYWATITVTDSDGKNVTVWNNKVTLEEGKTYSYLVAAPGFNNGTGTISTAGDIKVRLSQDSTVVVAPTSHGDVSFSYLSHGWVAVYVDPNNGYYLDDLTIYRVGYGAIDYGKWDNGVYYFRMRDGQQYIVDADFAAAPSEYRVYVDSSIMHGDVSVDTVYAEEGEWVYITVDPDVGYRLYNLTVTRPSGNTVKVEHVRDNVYRFSMPGVRVTVDAEFIRTVTPFTDVRLADWFYEYVSFAYRYGLMEGINSYQFAPDATATRAMVVQILYRMSGEPAVSYGSGFTDVASNAWYADAIAWAARNNIVNGTSAATFDPNAPVTREQFATMLYRYARYRGFNTSLTANILSYYDVNQVSEYAFEALQWACAEGIVNGTSTGYLTPQGNATRAQLAAMLMRFCNEYFDL